MNSVIESITCPITCEVMRNPVQGSDGHNYEREAIIRALKQKNESPITREPMSINDLKVNASIRFLCDKYHQGNLGVEEQIPKVKNDALVSNNNIKINHNCFKENKSLMLEFNVDNDSFNDSCLYHDIVLVIDHSGSMRTPVEAKNCDGKNIENGLSIQDIVNHAAKTIASTLESNSRLSIVMFDNNVDIVSNLIPMTDMNKSIILNKINTIKPCGQTNIWGGIEKAIEILDKRDDKSKNGAIIMLTDGVPNISPSRGEVDTLKKLRIKKNFTSPIYTFGFGYNLLNGLLYDIAKNANGGNAHIPDGGMIATVFCNYIGTILSTVALNLQLHIIPQNINENTSYNCSNILMGDFAFNYNSNEYIYDIGTIQYEQSRNIMLNLYENNDFTYYFTYKIGGQSYKSNTYNINNDVLSRINSNIHFNQEYLRNICVENIRKMINAMTIANQDEALYIFNETIKLLQESPKTPLVNGLLINFKGDEKTQGQVFLAITNFVYYKRWGEFYLDQLSRSLNQQIKPNFKDQGCLFGGSTFENIVDNASDIFDNLTPPIPSLIVNQQSDYRGLGGINTQSTPSFNMSVYNDPHGGCFDSNSRIRMADGSSKLAKDIKKNDIVMTLSYNNGYDQDDDIYCLANVVCVIETKIMQGMRKMCKIDDLDITPWHPIKYNNKWVFPESIISSTLIHCESMITLVLDNHHIILVNDIPTITLGHNYTIDVLNHPFYGTYAVIDFLQKQDGWENGYIQFKDIYMEYEKINNCVININYNKNIDMEIQAYESPI